jgi:hypothetical protein
VPLHRAASGRRDDHQQRVLPRGTGDPRARHGDRAQVRPGAGPGHQGLPGRPLLVAQAGKDAVRTSRAHHCIALANVSAGSFHNPVAC